MLRASINTFDQELTPAPIVTGVGDTGVEHGSEIMAFVDAVVLHDADEYSEARAALEARIGPAATDRAAMVAGNFSMMNRALDAVGAPVDLGYTSLAESMGLEIPPHLAAAG
ncbi:MAG: hypothetical protein ACI9C1_003562 [Candidatus Aldehydirespiratoraceae bacterium]|jgi:hypothetical protein